MAPLKVYVASATANPETKYRVQRTLMILDGLGIPFDSIDITKPEHAEARRFMRDNASKKEPNGSVLPPQFFYNDEYLGNYEDFDTSVEADTITSFLRLLPDAIESNVITNDAETQESNGSAFPKQRTEEDAEGEEEDEEWDEDEQEDEEENADGKKEKIVEAAVSETTDEKANNVEEVVNETEVTLPNQNVAAEVVEDEELEGEDEELEGEDEEWDEEEEET